MAISTLSAPEAFHPAAGRESLYDGSVLLDLLGGFREDLDRLVANSDNFDLPG